MLTVLLINQVVISFFSLLFAASNKREISKNAALKYRNKKFGFIAAVLALFQTIFWVVYGNFVAHDWRFALLFVVPALVGAFEKTLRDKTTIAVPSIDAEIGKRLRIGGRMFRLTAMTTSGRSDSMMLSFTDERDQWRT